MHERAPLRHLIGVAARDQRLPKTGERARVQLRHPGLVHTERLPDVLHRRAAEIVESQQLPVTRLEPRHGFAKPRPTFEDELELHRVDCASSHGMLDNYEFLLEKREEFAQEPIIPPPLVRGGDLIALGLKPGPRFGEILEAAETRQLEGGFRDRDEALEWVKRQYLGDGPPSGRTG